MMIDGLQRLAAAMLKQAAREGAHDELAAWREWAEDRIAMREAMTGAHQHGRRVSGSTVRPVDTEAARRSARYRR